MFHVCMHNSNLKSIKFKIQTPQKMNVIHSDFFLPYLNTFYTKVCSFVLWWSDESLKIIIRKKHIAFFHVLWMVIENFNISKTQSRESLEFVFILKSQSTYNMQKLCSLYIFHFVNTSIQKNKKCWQMAFFRIKSKLTQWQKYLNRNQH